MRSLSLPFVLAVALLPLALAVGCSPSDGDVSPAAGATEEMVFTVRGMTCEGCVGTVTNAVEAVPGVTKADVSLEKNEAVVTADPEEATAENIVAAIREAGYEAEVK